MLKENVEYIEGLKRFGIKLDLGNMEKICLVLGNPQDRFKSVHVGGTNGKGSTASLIANVFKESDYKVGLYTSPYVISFNERIKIGDEMISDEELDSLISEMRDVFDSEEIDVTFFEFTTALAFLYFSRREVDVAVIEVGLGGLLDSTNVIDSEISVITNIGLDHCNYLGKTKMDIARKKAGIIKAGQLCVTSEKDLGIRAYLNSICKSKGSKLVYTNDVFDVEVLDSGLKSTRFSVSKYYDDKFNIRLLGKHQIDNVLNALVVVNELTNEFDKINGDSIKRGIENAYLPGRIQIVSKSPLIIVDAAHNVSGMKVLNEFISSIENIENRKKAVVIGIAKDKDHEGMIKRIVDGFGKVVFTEGRFKPADCYMLSKIAGEFVDSRGVFAVRDVGEAVEESLEDSKEDDVIVITGSIYMIGEALKYFENKSVITNKLQQSL